MDTNVEELEVIALYGALWAWRLQDNMMVAEHITHCSPTDLEGLAKDFQFENFYSEKL